MRTVSRPDGHPMLTGVSPDGDRLLALESKRTERNQPDDLKIG
jgi:hypothetical protein